MSLISQSSSEQSICFSVPGGAGKRARARLLEEFRDEIARKEIDGIDVQDGLATVAVVGLGMAGHRGIAARVFAALAEAGINIVAIAQGSSELNISFVVAAKDAAPAQRAVHAAFQLAKIGGGSATRAAHRDVVLLGFGQIGRALAGIMAKASKKTVGGKRNGAASCGWRPPSTPAASCSSPGGLTARAVGELADAKQSGRSLARTRAAGGRAKPADALTLLASTRWRTRSWSTSPPTTRRRWCTRRWTSAWTSCSPTSARWRDRGGRAARCGRRSRAANQRMLTEATVGAGLPIFDSYRKLVESGDRVLKIEGCLSGTLGFVLTEVERGKSFSQALRRRDGARLHGARSARRPVGRRRGRKALILGRLLGFAGEPDDVAVESLVPAAMRKLARDAFLATPRRTGRRLGASAPPPRRRRARRCATSPRWARTISVGLQTVEPRRARSSASRGPTTRSRSRPSVTARTRSSSPARAPAPPSPPPAC